MKLKHFIILPMFFMLNNSCFALDFGNISPINPLDKNANAVQEVVQIPAFDLKRATLTRNDIKNQYTIAMDKFINSNIRASYEDFKILIESLPPSDYVYMRFSQEMASIGFFNLAELAISKIQDSEISSLLVEDVKRFYFPSYNLNRKDQIYFGEIYSNIMYNDQSREATAELLKQTSLLADCDYANYLVAFGSMKNGDIKQAKKYINEAISKNPQNLNYKRLKAEILAQSDNSKEALSSLNEIKFKELNTVIFDRELHSTEQYILYKTAKNDYWKKYHLAYYYYDKEELNKAIMTLQTSISGKKSINKEVYALSAKVYFDMKEYEKAQDYALKAVDIDSSNSLSLIILGDCAYRNKNYDEAQKYYKKAAGKDSTFESQIKLARTYQQQNNIQKAKDIYSKILKVSSKIYEAYYQMALLEKDREITYLKKAISINPNFKDGWLDLARTEINKDNFEKALSYLNIAKYIDDNDYRYYYYNGLVLKNKGLSAAANKSFEQCINLNPEYTPAKEELNI